MCVCVCVCVGGRILFLSNIKNLTKPPFYYIYIYIYVGGGGEDFVPGHPQACLSALGSQARTVLFSSDMRRLWVLMPYKCLAQAWVYHYHTCVVVVHSCLCQTLIRQEWGASLANMGLHSKFSHVTWEQNHEGLTPQSGQTSLRVARNKILPHKNGSGRGVPFMGYKIMRVSCGVKHGQANPTLAPKRTILLMGIIPQKRLFVCGNGTLMLVPSTYKAWVGRFSCRCGIALKVFPCRLRTKSCGLGSPKRTNKLAGGQE